MPKHYCEKSALVYSPKDNKTQNRPLSLGDQQQEEEATTCLQPEYSLNDFCLCQFCCSVCDRETKEKSTVLIKTRAFPTAITAWSTLPAENQTPGPITHKTGLDQCTH